MVDADPDTTVEMFSFAPIEPTQKRRLAGGVLTFCFKRNDRGGKVEGIISRCHSASLFGIGYVASGGFTVSSPVALRLDVQHTYILRKSMRGGEAPYRRVDFLDRYQV